MVAAILKGVKLNYSMQLSAQTVSDYHQSRNNPCAIVVIGSTPSAAETLREPKGKAKLEFFSNLNNS